MIFIFVPKYFHIFPYFSAPAHFFNEQRFFRVTFFGSAMCGSRLNSDDVLHLRSVKAAETVVRSNSQPVGDDQLVIMGLYGEYGIMMGRMMGIMMGIIWYNDGDNMV